MTDAPVILIAIIVVAVIVLLKRYRDRGRHPGRAAGSGVDVETDLLRACHGDRKLAERLIAHELEGRDDFSRTGAALLALAKLRDDQR
ncbi:MAG: hypothetical protein OEQ25_01375 [Gammaproteobacteria bacterium]|nr:hypothetical protein [Gammaproteobacteria bacterium]MDH3505765.1 hypothetical protein [Gammaproteobacteria bacterium]